MKVRQSVLSVLLASASMILFSCTEKGSPASVEEGSPCTVTLTVEGGTKAGVADSEAEARIANLKVFVFGSGRLDGYGSADGSSSVTFSATVGVRTVYALVNAPDALSRITTQAQLETALSLLLEDNAQTADRFVMVGRRDVTLSTDNSIVIGVERLVSRIRMGKVTRQFSSENFAALPASDVLLTRVFVSNAAGSAVYEMSGNPVTYAVARPSLWCSSEINHPSVIDKSPLLYCDLAGIPLAQDASADAGCTFYTYPNPTVRDIVAGGKYTDKVTRVVVELKMNIGDGWRYYTYPMLLGEIDNNTVYDIRELVITRPGNPSDGDDEIDTGEDDEVLSAAASFTVVPQPWNLELVTYGSGTPGQVIL